MRPSRALAQARRRSGLTQRALAAKANVPQSTIGRIESGDIDPRASTLTRLLRECGYDLEIAPLLGEGVDRSQIRERLRLTPSERIAEAAAVRRPGPHAQGSENEQDSRGWALCGTRSKLVTTPADGSAG